MTNDLRELAQHVHAAFGLPGRRASLASVARGAMGRVWRVSAGGEQYAMKEFFWEVDPDAVEREVRFHRLATAAGVRAPANLPLPGGGHLLFLPAELGGGVVRLYEWIDGGPIKPGAPGVAEQAAIMVAALHGIGMPADGQTHPWYEVVPDEDDWQELAEDCTRAALAWAEPLRRAIPAMVDLAHLVSPVPDAERVICHLDIQPANVLATPGGLVLIDWDNTGPGSLERETAGVLCWFADEPTALRAFAKAYEHAGGRGRPRGEESFAMQIASHLNYIWAQGRLALDTGQDEEHRTTASRETAEAVAGLPDRSVYRAILAAIA